MNDLQQYITSYFGLDKSRLGTVAEMFQLEPHRESKLDMVKSMLSLSFQELREVIEKHSEEELFEKKRYHWTGSTSLGSYLISATSSHYDWALKLIKRGLK